MAAYIQPYGYSALQAYAPAQPLAYQPTVYGLPPAPAAPLEANPVPEFPVVAKLMTKNLAYPPAIGAVKVTGEPNLQYPFQPQYSFRSQQRAFQNHPYTRKPVQASQAKPGPNQYGIPNDAYGRYVKKVN
eukprot:TRINITY_DN198_c0_g1_i1.p1 TRINITY_DN198_c0_g1~~TRINITY_DN198_c0_g1_i1.p1  ORF type:complete len:148 (+),score=45.68 TRINITY_DN198_c0_g1_i1:55-444(+)